MSRLVVGAVALLLALAGCGGDPKPDPSPSPSTPVTSPASTTPAPPVMPEEAKADTKVGAIAFVKYYIDTFNFAQSSGSTSELTLYSSVDCAACSAVIDGLERIYSKGGHIVGGELVAGAIAADFNTAESTWLVIVRVRSGTQAVYARPDASPSQLPGGRRSMNFSIERDGSSWKVTKWSNA